MTDRETVVKGLEGVLDWLSEGEDRKCVAAYRAVEDALELLTEQEAVKPKLVGVNTWTCGECGALLGWEDFAQSGIELIKYKYCPECGKAVKWND
jgi:ribosomal protein S27AE